MFSQSPFVGPGAGSLASHSIEILIMLLGAFVLGYLLSRVFAAKDRARIARLETQVAELLLASLAAAPALASPPLGASATGETQREAQRQSGREGQPEAHSKPRPNVRADVSPPAQLVPANEDDLEKIKGIGPSIKTALNAGGINTFAALALAGEQDLRHMLVNQNPRFRIHDPTSWPLQAAMARDGEWQKLDAWQKAARVEKK